MAQRVVIEEFHLTVLIPRSLPDTDTAALRRTLTAARFQRRLLQAVRTVFRQESSLAQSWVRLSR